MSSRTASVSNQHPSGLLAGVILLLLLAHPAGDWLLPASVKALEMALVSSDNGPIPVHTPASTEVAQASASLPVGVGPTAWHLPGTVLGPEAVVEARIETKAGGERLTGLVRCPEMGLVYAEAQVDGSRQAVADVVAFPGEYVIALSAIREKGLPAGMEIVRTSGDHALVRAPFADLAGIMERNARVADHFGDDVAGLNSVLFPAGVPNDPGYPGSWTLAKLDLEPVWAVFGFKPHQRAGRRPMIAVLDNGFGGHDKHLWVNPDEIPGNGLDDDDNGFVDDVHGWNFYRDTNDISYSGGHGSKVSAIAGSLTHNGIGGASPASSAATMRVLVGEKTFGGIFDLLDGMRYAIIEGADVVNLSMATSSSVGMDALMTWGGERGVIFVTSAGNGSGDLADSNFFPAKLPNEHLLTVGASNKSDRPNNSKFSPTLVDVFAPGDSTSFSSPLAASVVALLRALNPDATSTEVISAIVAGADRVPALKGLCVANGRLNARGAVEALLGMDLAEGSPPLPPEPPPEPEPEPPAEPPPPAPPEPPIFDVSILDAETVSLSWEATASPECLEWQVLEAEDSWTPAVLVEVDGSKGQIRGLTPGGAYRFRLRRVCGALPSDWTTSGWFELPLPEPALPGPVHSWLFDDVASGLESGVGSCPIVLDVSQLEGVPGVSGTGLAFTGDHTGLLVPGCPDQASEPLRQHTLAFWFKVYPSNQRHLTVLYETGGFWRGLNLLLDRGWLMASGWNRPAEESDWSGTTLSGGRIPVDEWTHVALVLDAEESLLPNRLHLYINGELQASGPASMIWSFRDASGFGQVHGSTSYRDRHVSRLHPFQGVIDEAMIWDRALTAEEIELLVLDAFSPVSR